MLAHLRMIAGSALLGGVIMGAITGVSRGEVFGIIVGAVVGLGVVLNGRRA